MKLYSSSLDGSSLLPVHIYFLALQIPGNSNEQGLAMNCPRMNSQTMNFPSTKIGCDVTFILHFKPVDIGISASYIIGNCINIFKFKI